MNLQNLLGFLLLQWANVYDWFANLFNSGKLIVQHLFEWLATTQTNAVTTAQQNTIVAVAGASIVLQNIIKVGNDLLHGQIVQAFLDSTVLIHNADAALKLLITATADTADTKLQQGLAWLEGIFHAADQLTHAVYDAYIAQLNARVDLLNFTFNKVISISGLTTQEKQELLKLFLDDPLGFIASVFFEIAIPILLYELCRGLTDATVDIGQAPALTSKTTVGGGGSTGR
jgi:hypothetical protein